jgi:glycosyltransferase involved in cell wall biosynthesis
MLARFDLIVNTTNEMSFDVPNVQYIHCPIRHPRTIRTLYSGMQRTLRNGNNLAFKVVSGFDAQAFRRNAVLIANSKWTATAIQEAYGMGSTVIRPPVSFPVFGSLAWSARQSGFVIVGRVAPDKRVKEAIHLVDAVRRRRSDVHLHIVGSGSDRYGRDVRDMAFRRPYVTIHEGISRIDLSALLGENRYGLHMASNEHFGVAIAEMLTSQMIVFAQASGGANELLGRTPHLLFETGQLAVESILQVMNSEEIQQSTREALEPEGLRKALTPEEFMARIRKTVRDQLPLSTVDIRARNARA